MTMMTSLSTFLAGIAGYSEAPAETQLLALLGASGLAGLGIAAGAAAESFKKNHSCDATFDVAEAFSA
ncbi:hypothetical protein ACLQ2P_11580 [Actinomadura citrea]|uniref:hypothetical protein n=1 Tax=Actinomadura TaxID=1988 RepID=UPI002E285793|nr:hypothetical protein [Actinomadura citrea]